jgi:hypothetical protein
MSFIYLPIKITILQSLLQHGLYPIVDHNYAFIDMIRMLYKIPHASFFINSDL